jgi:hypothetical protein
MALLLGRPPSEITELGATDFDLLHRYWNEEPWGPWRDNLHTAILAREVRRGNFKGQHDIGMFMLSEMTVRKTKERQTSAKQSVFGALKMLAGKKQKREKVKK